MSAPPSVTPLSTEERTVLATPIECLPPATEIQRLPGRLTAGQVSLLLGIGEKMIRTRKLTKRPSATTKAYSQFGCLVPNTPVEQSLPNITTGKEWYRTHLVPYIIKLIPELHTLSPDDVLQRLGFSESMLPRTRSTRGIVMTNFIGQWVTMCNNGWKDREMCWESDPTYHIIRPSTPPLGWNPPSPGTPPGTPPIQRMDEETLQPQTSYPLQEEAGASRERLIQQQVEAELAIYQRADVEQEIQRRVKAELQRRRVQSAQLTQPTPTRGEQGSPPQDPRLRPTEEPAGIIHVPDTPPPLSSTTQHITQLHRRSFCHFVSEMANAMIPAEIVSKVQSGLPLDLHACWQILSQTSEPGYIVAPSTQDGQSINFKLQKTNTARIPNGVALIQTVLVIVAAINQGNPDLGREWLADFPLAISKVLTLHNVGLATKYVKNVLDVLIQALRGQREIPCAALDLNLVTTLVTFEVPKKDAEPKKQLAQAKKTIDCIKWQKGLRCASNPCPYLHNPSKKNSVAKHSEPKRQKLSDKEEA